MNAQAVALAADSAVTVRQLTAPKIYNTANKLFCLSKHAPVAAMVYGQAQLTGVPWETVIKAFRRQLGTTTYATVRQYGEALISYMGADSLLIPRHLQEFAIGESSAGYCHSLVQDFEKSVEAHIEAHGSISQTELRRLLRKTLQDRQSDLEGLAQLPGLDETFGDSLVREFRVALDDAIALTFEKYPLTAADKSKLRRLLALVHSRDIFPDEFSGLVVAGFGEEEFFPALCSYRIHGVWLNMVKRKAEHDWCIGRDSSACIFPFAQSEMVRSFMEGIHPEYRDVLDQALIGFLDGLAAAIRPALGLSDTDYDSLESNLKSAAAEVRSKFGDRLEEYSQDSHVSPITSVVSILPKDELAAMAEALVNLTSFKRRVTMDPETVGGPIDVAVISKGDGFIWIKRKHYFRPELNPQFFATMQER